MIVQQLTYLNFHAWLFSKLRRTSVVNQSQPRPLVLDVADGFQRFLQSAVAGAAARVERRSRDGIGDIPPDFPVAVRAIQVTDFARPLTMRAQLGTPRKTLFRDVEKAADLVLL